MHKIDRPNISIVIPIYNRAKYLEATLNSVSSQTLEGWECILVDDCSADASREIACEFCKQDERFKLIELDANSGASYARNIGLRNSSGKWIQFFDSDDLLEPTALEEKMALAEDGVDAVVCGLRRVDEVTGLVRNSEFWSDDLVLDHLLENINFLVSGPIWRRDFLISHQLEFDCQLSSADDWDFNLRALYFSPKVALCNRHLITYVRHAGSITESSRRSREAYRRFMNSELNARKKHLRYVEESDFAELREVRTYFLSRFSHLLSIALSKRISIRFKLFWDCVRLAIKIGALSYLIRVMMGTASFLITRKGYRLLYIPDAKSKLRGTAP